MNQVILMVEAIINILARLLRSRGRQVRVRGWFDCCEEDGSVQRLAGDQGLEE